MTTTVQDINTFVQTAAATPVVTTYLKPNSFRFLITRAPNVTFTCQSANLPPVQLGAAMQPTPFVDIPYPGDKVSFGEFTVRFLINEDMSNYIELYNWIKENGTPYGNGDYNAATTQSRANIFGMDKYEKVFSDGALLILDSNNNPTVKLTFQDLFPISLEALDFDITTPGMEYFVGIASFRYKLFTIESLT